jgi:hypothetical protein
VVVYGRRYPEGYLPAFSVDTEAEARELIERCCEPVYITEERRFGHVAPELEEEQTLENLYAFGARLKAEYEKLLAQRAG